MMHYTNPVYDGYFADPHVLRTRGIYYAYGTGHGPERDGRQFPVLRSKLPPRTLLKLPMLRPG